MQGHKFFSINKNLKFIDKLKVTIVKLAYYLLNVFILVLTTVLWKKKINFNVKKVCVLVIGNIGDIVCSIPTIIGVCKAYPNAHITLLTSPEKKGLIGAKELLSNSKYFNDMITYYNDEIHNIKGFFNFVKLIRQRKFDTLIYISKEKESVMHLLKIIIFAKISAFKSAYGFWISNIKIFKSVQASKMFFIDDTTRRLKVLKEYGFPISDDIEYELPIIPEHKSRVSHIIEEHNLINANPIFGFVPGAKREANKWPAAHFNELAKLLINEFPKGKIIIFGGTDVNKDLNQVIMKEISDEIIIDLTGKLSILETSAMIYSVDILISNNTGVMHMAALNGNKVIGIFSAAEFKGKWYPYGVKSIVLIKDIDCKACYYQKCEREYECIKSITPAEVFSATKEILSSQ